MQVETFADARATQRFYEDRYAQGYMDFWDSDKLARVAEVVRSLDLPEGARVLDFGCGSGVFTRLLHEALPRCRVVGADISAEAVALARARHGEGAAFAVLDPEFVAEHDSAFDLVFSHHVLEHVFDLEGVAEELATMVAPNGTMLHVLPCGNPGSLHHTICTWFPRGIDAERGNRFFFEEPGHLRRLRTSELVELFVPHRFELRDALYTDQLWGAVRWMSGGQPQLILETLHPLRCRVAAIPRVVLLMTAVALLWCLRLPLQIVVRVRRLLVQRFRYRSRPLGSPRSLALLAAGLPALAVLPLAWPVDALLHALARAEWRRRRRDPGGAEMMLVLRRLEDSAPRSEHSAPALAAR